MAYHAMPYRRRPSEEAQTSSHPHARAAEKRRPSPHVAFAARIFLRKINRGPSIAYQTARGRPSRMFIREEGSQVDQGPGGQESAGGIERPRVTESITKCAVTLTRGATGWSDGSVHDSSFFWLSSVRSSDGTDIGTHPQWGNPGLTWA